MICVGRPIARPKGDAHEHRDEAEPTTGEGKRGEASEHAGRVVNLRTGRPGRSSGRSRDSH